MGNSAISSRQEWQEDTQVWENLKEAIANSSGFKRWEQESNLKNLDRPESLDVRVRRYLRETLETLAY
ncbi:MAG: hypothetical protein QNJ54_15865 [Prochloraceae cyanobacterium]|nr:hypothetical protein [Prochloraceae cyanobacterium]